MKRALSIAAAVLVLAPALALGWLMTTESGLRFAYRQVLPLLPGEFTATRIAGVLAGPITLDGVTYRQPAGEVEARRVEVDWNPWALLSLELQITSLNVDALQIRLGEETTSADENRPPPGLVNLALPLAIEVDAAQIDGIDFRRGESRYRIERLDLGLKAHAERFEFTRLAIVTADLEASFEGEIAARGNYPHDLRFDWRGKLPSGAELSGSGHIAGDLSTTRLTQQVQGALQLKQSIELDNLLSDLRWRSTIDAADIDLRRLDPGLPEISGTMQATAEGDLETATASGSIDATAPRLGAFAARFELRSLEDARRFDGLRVESLDLDTLDGKIAANGRIEWLPAPGWTANISTAGIDPAGLFAGWPGRIDGRIGTSGSLDDGRLVASVDIGELNGSLRDFPVTARGNLKWDDGSIEIGTLEIGSGNTRISAAGRAGDTLDLKWKLDSGDLGELYPGAAGSLAADGVLGGRRDAPRIEAKFEGRDVAWDVYRLGSASGRVSVDPLQLERFDLELDAADVSIQDLQFASIKLVADPRRIEARLEAAAASARIGLEGRFEGYDWDGKLVGVEIDSRDYSSWKLLEPAALRLSSGKLSATRVCLGSPQQARVCGSLDTRPETWDFALDAERLQLALLAPWTPPQVQLEGVGGARANLTWRQATRQLLGSIDVALEPGRADLTPVPDKSLRLDYRSAKLELQMQESQIEARAELALDNGDSLQANARLPGASLTGLDFTAQPLEGTLQGRIRDLGVAKILTDKIERLSGLLELDLAVSGDTANPRVTGELRLSEASLRAALPGHALELENLDLVAQGDASSRVTYRARASLGNGSIELDGDTRLDERAGWPSRLRLKGKDLAAWEYLKPWLPTDVSLEGIFDVAAELRFSAPSRLVGKVDLRSAEGVVHYPLLEDEFEHWQYREATFDLLLDESGISGDAAMSLGDNNRLQGRLRLPQARLLALEPDKQPLDASARFEFNQLEILQALLPDISKPRGRLTLDMNAAGTLAQPRLNGRAELADAAVDIPRLGVKITKITMTGASGADGRFNFELGARSGDGNLVVTGSSLLDAGSGWPTRIEINGENFEAARIPEASVNLSPALVVVIANRSIDIGGDLRVPFARLQPRDITTAETTSSDTVVIGGEQAPSPGWLINTHINLILGDRVAFYGYGFEGQLTGKLTIEQQPGQLTSGTGEITVPTGKYRAYGQRLDIENGRVLFTGGPITNPGLDIRATRDSNGIITGLLVRGRLRQPQIELFSIPAMGQTDILSYLLFGRPLETASGEDSALMAQAALTLGLAGGDQIARSLRERFGLDEFRVETTDSGDQASLVVGRYLSPDVYVSYAVGLIESANSLNLRYRITDHWQLKAESGISHGADLLYSIER